ncbi:MAG: sulfotransferase [Planctomycetota bacterium]
MAHPPVFIIGSPRSGTTLLGNVLSAHPDVAYAEEPRLIWRIGNDRRSDYLRPEDARPEVVKAIRERFDQTVSEAGKVRLLEKTPSNALRLDFMRAVYPEGIFIHVLRNAYDAVLSIRSYSDRHSTGVPRAAVLKRLREVRLRQLPHYGREMAARVLPKPLNVFGVAPAWGPRLPAMTGLQGELDPLQIACLQWRSCVEAACQAGRAFPEGRYMEFRLEDLDESVLRKVMDFAGLPESPEVIETFREKFRPQDPTGRRKAADLDQLRVIRRWTEPTMEWLGYPTELPESGESDE